MTDTDVPVTVVDLLPLQAVSRAVMAGFTGQTAGRQAYLSEAGRAGVFEWVAGNQSAFVNGDPDQAIYVAPTSQLTGSAGAWRRIFSGTALATWAGVLASGVGDYAPQLNRLLARSDVSAVQIPRGTTRVAQSVQVPSGKWLYGYGPGISILKALAFVRDPVTYRISVVYAQPFGVGTRVSDLTVDGNKEGSHFINGVNFVSCSRFVCERVTSINVSNYAFWAVTDYIYGIDNASGVFRDCWSFNANSHFETTFASNVTFERCHARDGDGDIDCECYFHPVSGSKYITYRDCSGIGKCSSPVSIGSYTAEPLEHITFENCYLEATVPHVAVAINSFEAPIRNLQLNHCTIISPSYYGLFFSIGNNFPIEATINGGSVRAVAQGITITDRCTVAVNDVSISVTPISPTAFAHPLYVDAGAMVIVNGGTWATPEGRASYPASQTLTVLAPPRLIGTPQTRALCPFGIGHKTRSVLSVDAKITATVATFGGGANGTWDASMEKGVFEIEVEGMYQTSDTTTGIGVRAESYGTRTVSGTAQVDSRTDGTGFKRAVVNNAGAYLFSDPVQTANTPFPFRLKFTIRLVDDQAGFNISGGPYRASTAAFAGELTILAGSTMTIEQVA